MHAGASGEVGLAAIELTRVYGVQGTILSSLQLLGLKVLSVVL